MSLESAEGPCLKKGGGVLSRVPNPEINLIPFIDVLLVVLILAQIDYSTKWTVYASAVYFWSRVAHLIVYIQLGGVFLLPE